MKKPVRSMIGTALAAAMVISAATAVQAAAPPPPQAWTLNADVVASAETDLIHTEFGSPDRTGGTDYYLRTEVLSEADGRRVVDAWGTTRHFEPDQTFDDTHASHLPEGRYVIRQSVFVGYLSEDPADNGRLLSTDETTVELS